MISRQIPESVIDSRWTHHFLNSWHQEFGVSLTPVRSARIRPSYLRPSCLLACARARACSLELELELIQTQMTQKPMLRAEVYARALRASQNRKEDSV